MLGLRNVLGPARAVTPERIALATVAALGAAAAPLVVSAVPESARLVGNDRVAMTLIALSTAALSSLLARRALAATTTLAARLWLVLGGAGAGFVNTVISFFAAILVVPGRHDDAPFGLVLLASLVVGSFFGFLFGTAFAPVVVAAARARLSPSHEGADRVLFTGGATLVAFAIVRALIPFSLAGASLAHLAAILGLAALAVSSARILARARFLTRVHEGLETGLHVVPRADLDDEEAALLPLCPAAHAPSGVLTATGASAPYRGARGVFKLALVPLPDERVEHPISSLFWSTTATVSDTILTLILGSVSFVAVSFCFGFLAFVWSAITAGG
jgi:hypothetical protein